MSPTFFSIGLWHALKLLGRKSEEVTLDHDRDASGLLPVGVYFFPLALRLWPGAGRCRVPVGTVPSVSD